MKRTLPFALAIAFVCAPVFLAGPAFSAEPERAAASQETKAEVPELTEFHEVIYQLWHEAWPKKDLAALSALLPGIEAGAAKVEKAALPGILRDKKPAWDANVKLLGEIVIQYREAVAKKELQPILDAGEALHRQYEVLVRTIRPALKELDAFHQVLYALYHHDLQAWALPKIQADARELKEKMLALNKATLPQRMAAKQADFDGKRKDLDSAVNEFAALAEAGKDEKAIRAAAEAVHAKYVALDQVF